MTDFTKYDFYKTSYALFETKLFGIATLVNTEVAWMDGIWPERRYQLHYEFRNKKLEDLELEHGYDSKEYNKCYAPKENNGITTLQKLKEYTLPFSGTGFKSMFLDYSLLEDPRKWDTSTWWKSIRSASLWQLFGDTFEDKSKHYEKIGLTPFIPVGISINTNVEAS